MRRFVTLVAAAVIGAPSGTKEGSSRGKTRSPPLFPNDSFHLDVFLATTGVGCVEKDGAERTEDGRPYMGMGKGSCGTGGRQVDGWPTDACEARLISRARDCDASAREARVSSRRETGDVRVPLPRRAPRLRRLFVDVERECMPSVSTSASASASASASCSSCSSCSWSYTVDNSDASRSYTAGPREGAREAEREALPERMPGVR